MDSTPGATRATKTMIAAITKPETWPDYATELGRFTPLRAGGLAGQTFEIEVAANTRTALPVFTRGYVTITTLVTPADEKALHDWFEALEAGMEKYGNSRIVPGSISSVCGRYPMARPSFTRSH